MIPLPSSSGSLQAHLLAVLLCVSGLPLVAAGVADVDPQTPVHGWSQTGKVVPTDNPPGTWGPANGGLHFGSAIEVSGDTMVVGTAIDSATDTPYAYIFERNSDGHWEQTQRLPSQIEAGPGFGMAVAVDDQSGVLVVGDPGYDKPGADNADRNDGTIHVYEREPGKGWVHAGQVTGRDDGPGNKGAEFGGSVAVDGHRIAVSAGLEDQPNKSSVGAAYVVERDPNTGDWTRVDRLVPDEPKRRMFFGGVRSGIAIEENTVVVGAPDAGPDGNSANDPGAVFTFERTPHGDWTQTQRLPAPEPSRFEDAGRASFGFNLALDQGRLAVGAVGWNPKAASLAPVTSNTGAAFVYDRSSHGWTLEAQLQSASTVHGDWFGKFLDIDGDVVVVGAHHKPEPQGRIGTAHVFERTDGGWQEIQLLASNESSRGDYFGWGLALDEGTLAIGAPFDGNRNDGTPYPVNDMSEPPIVSVAGTQSGESEGSVYVFEKTGDQGPIGPSFEGR